MRLIDLSLDQLSTNSLLCRLRYDSSPCPSSSSVFRPLLFLLLLVSESVPRIYMEREKEQHEKRTEEKMRKSQSNIKKWRKHSWERKMNSGALESRERERTWLLPDSHINRFLREGFSFTCPTWNYLSDVPFDAILNKDINHSMEFWMTLLHHTSAFSIHCVISLNLCNLMKCSIISISSWWCAPLRLS